MKKIRLTLMCMLLLFGATVTLAQKAATDYNPFVSANLDDPNKVVEAPAVESSYHKYSVVGDAAYTEGSTFIWYVENGAIGTYDPVEDDWIPTTPTGNISNGYYYEMLNAHSSEVWVKWNDGSNGSYGYVAVYEKSSSGCIEDGRITGFKHLLIAPPEVWFSYASLEECSEQNYSVDLTFNEIYEHSYPYTLSYTYPNEDGTSTNGTLVIDNSSVVLTSNGYVLNLNLVHDLNVTLDESYNITLTGLRDKYGSVGKIAPLGTSQNQFSAISFKVLHLPQTNGMTME